MRYLSLFDGIGAACVAWDPLGWECVGVSEIEKFPISVTTHHRPQVPHLGDVTKITEDMVAALGRIDLIVGGFPCQDLSVAGKRAGLKKEDGTTTRSGLFFDAMRVVQWARQHCGLRWLLIENVPGLYSSNRGRDFAAVVGEMVGAEFDVPRDGWRNAGFAVGPEGLCEWATLDAQFFNVAQRRVRVFALADFGDWANRPPILLERESLRGDSAPSREARKDTAGSTGDGVARCITTGESKRQDWEPCNFVAGIAPTLQAGGNSTGGDRPPGTTVDTADSLIVAHTLRGEGFDAGEDGTGRGTPIVPVVAPCLTSNYGKQPDSSDTSAGPMLVPVPFDTTQITSLANYSAQRPGDPCHPLAAGAHAPAIAFAADDYKDGGYEECDTARPLTTSADRTRAAPVIAFSGKDYGADAGEVAPTLRSMGHDGSHANGGGQVVVCIHADAVGRTGDALTPSVDAEGRVRLRPPGVGIASDGTTYNLVATGQPHAVAFESRFARNGRGAPSDVVPPLKAQSGETGKGDGAPLLATAMQVRRLTPVECSRLQGFPDDYLLQVPWRGKTPPPDGPMYKALGNSMAVPVMRWIGQQIAAAASSRTAA